MFRVARPTYKEWRESNGVFIDNLQIMVDSMSRNCCIRWFRSHKNMDYYLAVSGKTGLNVFWGIKKKQNK